jgi:hypothetical protein
MNRRNFIALLTGALAAPVLLAPKRTFFLPPVGGWPVDALSYTVTRAEIADNLYLARLIVPGNHAHFWNEEIAAGRCTYDMHTEMLTMYQRPPEGMYTTSRRVIDWQLQPWAIDENGHLAYRGDIQAKEVLAEREFWASTHDQNGRRIIV